VKGDWFYVEGALAICKTGVALVAQARGEDYDRKVSQSFQGYAGRFTGCGPHKKKKNGGGCARRGKERKESVKCVDREQNEKSPRRAGHDTLD